ncbi:MAG: hypothetical protein OXI56_06590 [bacterium]|nr:hypothetical protein [bacterium]MDE0601449.1 hypothetical protein [bacterium]
MRSSPGAATAGGLCLLAALAWAGAISVGGGPWAPAQSAVLAGGLVALSTAALVGVVMKNSRWGRRMAGWLAAGELGLAMAIPLSGWWWAGVGAAATALTLVAGPWLSESGRRRAPTLGPPARAVLLLCVLAGLPVAIAAVSVNGLGGGWALAALSAAAAGLYAKAVAGSLLVTRFVVPAVAVPAAFTTPWPGWTVVVAGAGVAAWAAWSEDARLAVRPLVDTRPDPVPGPTPLRIRSARETARPRPAATPNRDRA